MGRRSRFWIASLIGLVAPVALCAQAAQEGDLGAAREALAAQARSRPSDVSALTNYAEFLERHGDPAAREAYRNLLAALGNDATRRAGVAKRLARLDLLAGDRDAANRDLEVYSAAAGHSLTLSEAAKPTSEVQTINIPGPLRSFARMAALSPEIAPSDVLPALARNVVTSGYQMGSGRDGLEPTEYLKLLHRYISQANELQALAKDGNALRVEKCESAEAGELLRVLGYRIRGGCGSELVLETVNAARAFITSDSGFPLNDLEQALRTSRSFSYPYHPSTIPVLFGPAYWGLSNKDAIFIDAFISDPSACRLYLGLSKLDTETAEALRKAIPLTRAKAFAHVLDFYGGMFAIRNGKAVTPGGARSAAAWGELAGGSPDQGAAFFDKLISRDDGWMASYFDALARIRGPIADYLTEPSRLKRFYSAIRGRVTSPGPARPVFRANADMMLLTTRLRMGADGKPQVPGDLEVWKRVFVANLSGKIDSRLSRGASAWKDVDDLIEGLFGMCRKDVDNQPLRVFLAISDVDNRRVTPLDSTTVERMTRLFRPYYPQYAIFNESRAVTGRSVNAFLDTAEALSKTKDSMLRNDAVGMFQALVGIWQILVRQGDIPEAKADSAFAGICADFAQIRGNRELFDAGRRTLTALLDAAAPATAGPNAKPAERAMDLLAGGPDGADPDAREQTAQAFARVLDAQRVVSLNLLFELGDHLEAVSRGAKLDVALARKLAAGIGEIELPRASLSGAEKLALPMASWPDRHIDAQRNLNLRAAVERAANDPDRIREARGLLAPLLRDTLVALNYAYYAPPGAQAIYTNPLLVRSHDFIGMGDPPATWRHAELYALGWPSNNGGRLVGSLASIAYALAEAEQNFLVPTHTQALIWTDLAPQMLASATLSRWWKVTPVQVHWAGLHMQYGREMLAESALDPAARAQTLAALSELATPARATEVAQLLEAGRVRDAVDSVTPAELFWIARSLAAQRPDEDSAVLSEIRALASRAPAEASYAALSRVFGTPKPTLANSYSPDLLDLRTFPALMGYSSRILAESWESNTLYWAALADQLYLPPGQLNVRIPEWTRQLVERIFASHLEDWPALLRSLRGVGEEERARANGAPRVAWMEGTPNR